MGVPDRQTLNLVLNLRTDLAVIVFGFLMFWASSRMTEVYSYLFKSSRSRRKRA